MSLGRAQGLFYLAANPIAVRSPYLSCWFPLIYGTTWDENLLSTSDLSQVCTPLRPVAMFLLRLSKVLGWNVLVNIDSTTYIVLGPKETIALAEPFIYVNITHTTVTPTQTVFTTQAGPMQINLTYLNPIEVRLQSSIPFIIHMSIFQSPVISSGNLYHFHTSQSLQHRLTIQPTKCKYTRTSLEVREVVLRNMSCLVDITAEWMSGNRTQDIRWNVTSNTDVIYHTVTLGNPVVFSEVGVQAEWGTLYYAMKSVSDNGPSVFVLSI